MSFTQTQVRKLRSKLRPENVRTREAEGVALSYLEGWHVVAEANRIFGFDGWDRETVSSECVWTKQIDGRYCAAYVTRIRIRVRAGGASVVREGSGAGESNATTPGQAHEFASKAAETDATKRALMTFGNAFGLSLYGGVAEPRSKSTSAGGSVPAKSPAEVDKTGAPLGGADLLTDQSRTSSAEPYSRSQSGTVKATLPVTLPGPTWPEIRPLEEAARLDRERQDRIDKSRLALSEPRRERDLGHLAFVASKPCLICGRNRTHAHHLKFAQPTALGRKVSDEFTVPLCSVHHRELHAHGDERVWWRAHGIDALAVALELWAVRHPRTNEAAAEADRSAGPS
jgi:DNA recombination protein Rad52